MKNRGRNKLFMCFRPVATDEGPIKFKTSNGYGDPVPTYMALGGGGKERTMISGILTSPPDEENSGAGIDRKEKSRRRFSRALKAVLFDVLLAKKIGSKKYRINSLRSNSNLSKKISNITRELLDAEEEDMLRTNSSRSSSVFSYTTNGSGSLCSSRASSTTSNSRSVSERNGSFRTNSMELKHVPIPTKKVSRGFFSSNTGLSFLLLSLLVLIFWGKVCAILCTSTWLFFMPGQSKGGDLGMLEVDSDEYKKRIILEGLLERNRSRQL